MHLVIKGSLNWWSLVAFEKTINGPKVTFFDSKHYGVGLEHLLVELSLRDERGPKRDYTSYRNEPGRAQFCLVMEADIKAIEEAVAFRSIANRMFDGLENGFKRRKIPDFDYVAFMTDLKMYVAEKTNSA